ncbi:TonB-dependent receptor [Sunxiuqinia dokdonensis]|nr:TonB-dependent receptor plug domain-containing protein [Sunxiuqinia dokdonensis]
MKKTSYNMACFLLIMLLSLPVAGQEKMISVQAENKSLSLVLEELSETAAIRFAFDADYFSEIKVNLQYEQVLLTDFLNELSKKYHLLYDEMDGTYVLYRNPAPLPEPKPELITFRGKVFDQNTGEPLLFCNVGLGEQQGTITNELGIFSAKVEKAADIRVQISHLGYRQLDTTLQIASQPFHQLELAPFDIHIETINVYQQEKNVLELGSQPDRMAFNPKQSENLPRIDDSDLVTALTLIPGVNFLGGENAGISIRGGSPSENLILLDGMPVLETSHLFGNLSVLNAKYISQAFVSRGAFDARYGERISGIVELTGKSNYYRPSLDLSANLLNVNATGTVPIGKVASLSGAYRKSYIDQWENYLYRQILEQGSPSGEDESAVVPTVAYDDLNFKFSLTPSEKQEISISVLEGNDLQDREFLFNENSRLYRNQQADSKNRGISGNWRYQPNTNWQLHLNAGYNELERSSGSIAGLQPNRQGKGGKEELDTDDNQLQELIASMSAEWTTGNYSHAFGFGFNHDQVSYTYLSKRTTGAIQSDSINYDSKLTILHAYLQEKVQLTDRLQARLGMRVNHENQQNKLYLQPRWGMSYDLSDAVKLFYSGGTYYQFLSRIRKIDSNGNSDLVWYLPDSAGMGILESQQHVLGFRYEKNGLSVDVEPYYKSTTGKLNLYAETSGGKEKTIHYVQRSGEARNYGLDALVHYKQGIFTHMLAYSLSESVERFEVFNNGQDYPSFDDQRHRLRWTEMARYKSWIISTNLTYHTGSPFLMTEGESSQEFGRLPFFVQADFSLIKRWNYKFFTLSSGVSLLNFLNRENVLEIDNFSIADEAGSYSVRTDVTAMRFTPVFFFNIKLQ